MGNPGGLNVNPQGTWVGLQASQQASGARRVGVPQWITDDGYTRLNEIRTKVGDAIGSSRAGIHRIGSDSITWLDVAEAVKGWAETHEPGGVHLPEQRAAVAAGEVPVQSVQFRGWNDAGTWGLLSAGSRDNKHRWVMTVEAASGELHLLQHVADSAWVGGPCGQCAGWLPGEDRVYFVSEADRFAHLYTAKADGSDLRQLTSGEWEVHSVQIPEQNDRFILRTSEGSPFEQHMYSMDFDGSDRTRLTSGTGRFVGSLSPDGRRMAIVHSTQTRPEELYLADARAGAEMARVTTSPSGDFLAFPWMEAEIIRFPAQDGAMVPARIYRPRTWAWRPTARRSSSCTGPATCRTFTNGGRATTGSGCSTTTWWPRASRCWTSTTGPPPATGGTGAPGSTGGWGARTSRTTWTAWTGW
jgi:hypothetical protein